MSDTCKHCGSPLDWEEGCGGPFCSNGCDQTVEPKANTVPQCSRCIETMEECKIALGDAWSETAERQRWFEEERESSRHWYYKFRGACDERDAAMSKCVQLESTIKAVLDTAEDKRLGWFWLENALKGDFER